MSKPAMSACLRRKRIYLTRSVIAFLGNPSHLSFWYDETESILYVTAADKDELDAYEIPGFYWKESAHTNSCEVVRRAFFEVLQYRTGWEDKSKYSYMGSVGTRNGAAAIVFDMTKGIKIR